MATETTPTPSLQLSEGYRHARRLTSVLCALALLWGAAQFEFKTLKFELTGSIDLSGASLPIILACAIAYAMTRCVLEFVMQPIEVRRWNLAQVDFKITVFLVRAAALILGAGVLFRSIEIIVIVVFSVLTLLVVTFLFIASGVLALTPLRIRLRRRKELRGASPVWAVQEAEGYAVLISEVVLVSLVVAVGVGFFDYEPLRSLLVVPPTAINATFFMVTWIAVILSAYLQPFWSEKIFVVWTEEPQRDGSVVRTYKARSPLETDFVVRINKHSKPD